MAGEAVEAAYDLQGSMSMPSAGEQPPVYEWSGVAQQFTMMGTMDNEARLRIVDAATHQPGARSVPLQLGGLCYLKSDTVTQTALTPEMEDLIEGAHLQSTEDYTVMVDGTEYGVNVARLTDHKAAGDQETETLKEWVTASATAICQAIYGVGLHAFLAAAAATGAKKTKLSFAHSARFLFWRLSCRFCRRSNTA